MSGAEVAFADILIQAVATVAVSAVAQAAFGPEGPNIEGPRLNDLRAQTSVYGNPIPVLFGTHRFAGTLVWATELIESVSSSGGGKGAPNTGTSTQYTYAANFAIVLCAGEITGIRRVWADGRLIHNPAYASLTLPFARVYTGTETQLPDPFVESVEGIGKTPAYRGLAYVVFENYQLAEFGNRIPQLNFEVERSVSSTVGAQGSAAAPFLNGTISVETTSTAPLLAGVSATKGAALWQNDVNSTSILAVERLNAGNYGYETVIHTASPTPSWAQAASLLPYATLGGTNNPAVLWGGQAQGRRVIFEQTGGLIVSNYLNSAAIGAVHAPLESFQIPGNFIGGTKNFSKMSATTADRHKAIVNIVTHRTYLCAMSHAGNVGGVLANGYTAGATVQLAYDYATRYAQGWRLLDVSFDGDKFWTVESEPAPSTNCVLRRFNGVTFNYESEQPMPATSIAGGNDWRIHRRTTATYCVERTTGMLWLELTGRWSKIGALTAADAAQTVHWGAGRDLSFSIIRPTNSGGAPTTLWQLTRYSLNYDPLLDALPGFGGGYPLADIITELSAKADVPATQLDVSTINNQVRGYLVPRPMSARGALEVVTSAHFVAGVESNGLIRWYKLADQAIAAVIPDAHLDCHMDSEPAKSLMSVVRAQEVELPQRVTVIYSAFNKPNYSFEEGEVHAQRLNSASKQEVRVDLAISYKINEVNKIADAMLQRAWLNRVQVAFTTNRTYSHIEPGDLVQVRDYVIRLTEKLESNGVIQWRGVVDDPTIYPFISANSTAIDVADPNDVQPDPPDPEPDPA